MAFPCLNKDRCCAHCLPPVDLHVADEIKSMITKYNINIFTLQQYLKIFFITLFACLYYIMIWQIQYISKSYACSYIIHHFCQVHITIVNMLQWPPTLRILVKMSKNPVPFTDQVQGPNPSLSNHMKIIRIQEWQNQLSFWKYIRWII